MRTLLIPAGWLYGAAMMLRNFCYDLGILSVSKAGVPVISVGNISAGGTGKTPFVEYLIRYLTERNRHVAVLTRGYGRTSKDDKVVRGSTAGSLTYRETGDEPLQIALKFPDIPVVVGARRTHSARKAVDQEAADVLIMDDGFQHRSLHRDLDIVLVDESAQAWTQRMLPAGMLREPVSSLGRADVVVHTRVNPAVSSQRNPANDGKSIEVKMELRAGNALRFGGNGPKDKVELKEKRVLTFCGIGNPDSFRKTVTSLGGHVVESMEFPDHYPYGGEDIDNIVRTFETCGADWMATTEKDAIRLRGITEFRQLKDLPVCVVPVEATLIQGREAFLQIVNRVVGIP